MKYYKLKEKIEGMEYEAGHVFETDDDGDLELDNRYLSEELVALFVKKAVLSEVEDDGLGWLPNKGDNYCFLIINNEIHTRWNIWDNDDSDKIRRETTGVYKTKEEAIEVGKRMLKAVRG